MTDTELQDKILERIDYADDTGDHAQACDDIIAIFHKELAEREIAAQNVLIDALIDLFMYPPAEVGAVEDTHLHPHQIRDILNEVRNHLDDLCTECKGAGLHVHSDKAVGKSHPNKP